MASLSSSSLLPHVPYSLARSSFYKVRNVRLRSCILWNGYNCDQKENIFRVSAHLTGTWRENGECLGFQHEEERENVTDKEEKEEGGREEEGSHEDSRLDINAGGKDVLEFCEQSREIIADSKEIFENERQKDKGRNNNARILTVEEEGVGSLFVARSPVSRPSLQIEEREEEDDEEEDNHHPWSALLDYQQIYGSSLSYGISSSSQSPYERETEAWRFYLEGSRGKNNKKVEVVTEESQTKTMESISERVVYLATVGVDVERVLHSYPKVLTFSLANLKAKVKFLEARCVKSEHIGKVLSSCPEIFGLNVQTELLPVALFMMEEVKLPKWKLGKIFYRYPKLLTRSEKQLRENLEFLKSLGIRDIGKTVYNNPGLLGFSIKERMLPHLDYLKSLGIPEPSVRSMISRFPPFLLYSIEDNVKPKVDYLTKVMKRSVKELEKYPQYFGSSLEFRIRPRFQYLCQNQVPRISLPSMLLPSDEFFYDRFRTTKADKQVPSTPVAAMQIQKAIEL